MRLFYCLADTGDHEQLRPITAVYELSRSYNMNVSLFERLVKNGMDCPVLNVQHRMRPEISCLISPLIYKDLKNHDSVRKFESIRGVANDVFFVDHNKFENSVSHPSTVRTKFERNRGLENIRPSSPKIYKMRSIFFSTKQHARKRALLFCEEK